MILLRSTPDPNPIVFLQSRQGLRIMKRCHLVAFFALLCLALPTRSQESQDSELAFVQQLRARGYADLALEYLEKRLAKDPKYAADLPLEVAHTRLDMAA